MLKSMTGFGSAQASAGDESVSVEVRSVNHKFCEVKVRCPRELVGIEQLAQKMVKATVARGAVDVAIRRVAKSASGVTPVVDVALAREYYRVHSQLARELGLPDEVRLQFIASQPQVIRIEEMQMNLEQFQSAVEVALSTALESLVRMRTTEGQAIAQDLQRRLSAIQSAVVEVRPLVEQSLESYRTRLRQRVAELIGDAAIDAQRIAQEVVIFAERTDVAEELTRLDSHVGQFRSLFSLAEPSGRKMDFLVQEMNREINTIGSKSQSSEIANRVVLIKTELERIREQVQNIE